MADPPSLSQETREKIKQYLERWRVPVCPLCGSDKWFIGEHLVQPFTVNRRGHLQAGGVTYPQVMVISEPCGYTMFINAVAVGVMTPSGQVSET